MFVRTLECTLSNGEPKAWPRLQFSCRICCMKMSMVKASSALWGMMFTSAALAKMEKVELNSRSSICRAYIFLQCCLLNKYFHFGMDSFGVQYLGSIISQRKNVLFKIYKKDTLFQVD